MCITPTRTLDREISKLHPKSQFPEKPNLNVRSRVVSFKGKTMKQPIILSYQTLYMNIALGQFTRKKLASNRRELCWVLVNVIAAM